MIPGRDTGAENAAHMRPGSPERPATSAPPSGSHPHRPLSLPEQSRPLCQHHLNPNPWQLMMTGWNGQQTACLLCGQVFTLLKASLTGAPKGT